MTDRPVKLKYLVSDTDRHGNTRYYVRRPGKPKLRIRDDPGSSEFYDAYVAAVASEGCRVVPEKEPETHVYIASAGERPVKVGIALHPERRARTLRTGSPNRIDIRYTFLMPRSHAVRLERRTLRLLRDRRLFGEWLDMTVEEAIDQMRAIVHAECLFVIKFVQPNLSNNSPTAATA